MKYLASTKLQPTMRNLTILIFILWSSTSYTQSTKDSLSELQSLLDSIPDISLAELGIDTTAEIVPDTLHLVIPASIAADTAYARTCLNQAVELIKTGKYDDAYAKADTAKHIYQMNIGYVSKEVADCLHQMGKIFYFRRKDHEAIDFNKKTLGIRIRALCHNHLDIGASYNNLGNSYFSNGQFEKAIKNYFKALEIRLKSFGSNHPDVGASYINLGVSFDSKGEYDKAIEFKQKALNIRIKIYGYDHADVGTSLNSLGISYDSKGESEKAIVFKQKALDIRIKTLGPDHPDVGASYYNLGICHDNLNEFDKAVENYLKSLEIYKFNHKDTSSIFQNIGVSYDNKGDYSNAIKFKKIALNTQLKGRNQDLTKLVNCYTNLGVSYYNSGQFRIAVEYNLKALNVINNSKDLNNKAFARIYNNLAGAFEKLGDYISAIGFQYKALEIRLNTYGLTHPLVAASYNNLGVIYDSKGESNKAIEFYQKGLDIRIRKFGFDHPDVGGSYNNLGVSFWKKGEYDKAIDYHQKALDISLKTLGVYHPSVGTFYNNLGLSYKSKEEYDKAIENYIKGLDIRIKSLGPVHPRVLSSQKSISEIYQKLNQLDSSIYYIHQAIFGIKAQMSSAISAETKNLYQSQNIPVFESAIDVSLIKSKQDQDDSLKLKTYEYTELAKASLLQSQIKQTDALTFAGIPDSLLQKEYDLRIDINWREKQRQGLLEKGKTETDTTVLRISSIIFDLKREQETLFETLEKDYPEYYRLKYDTKTISLEDTQHNLLQNDQTMLEYFVGDSSIFIFVVRPDTFEVVQVKKDFALDSLVRQMQSGLYGYYGQSPEKRTDVLYKKSILDYTNAAYELYRRILAPVAHLLTSDLIIIPDGVLGYVPFEALLKSKPEKLNQFASYPYMINDHTISYNYSATLWQEMKNKKHKKEPSKLLVAFAPFYEGSFTVLDSTINLVFDTLPDGRDTTIFEDIVSRKTYAPLPGSGIEAGTVSKLYKGDYFVNSDATEQKFYDVAGDYRMVHLSTHGVADARQGDYSYLAFAEQKDSIENEFLYVRDIYNTQLNADLVFLSACETAQGELQRGEGIISLARAFAYAGAKSIITTLWQVDDTATKDISIDFYKNLKKGFPKDVALRQAKLRHIKSAKSAQKHPFFWAAMIGIGDMGEVKN